MKVSVIILAYNHEKFISKAIKSVVSQKTDFDFEIIIGEDQSSDGTGEIVRKFEKEYPDFIRPIYHKYPSDFKRTNGWLNFKNCFQKAKGEYLAYLDGDDFWLDDNKLQKQANILDNNQEYVLVHHNTEFRTHEGEFVRLRYPSGNKKVIEANDLIIENRVSFSTCMYRNIFNEEFPDFLENVHTVDRFFNMWTLLRGNAYYIDEVMSVYSCDSGGIFNKLASKQRIRNRINDFEYILPYFPEELHHSIKSQITKEKGRLFKQHLKQVLRFFKKR